MKIQLIRNATMKIEYGTQTFLADPMLAAKKAYRGFMDRENLVNPTTDLPISKDEIMEDVTSILVTHTHIPSEGVGGPSDHFDETAIETIRKDIPIYTQSFDVEGLKRVGFENITSIDEHIEVDGIKISRIEGRHADIDELLSLVGECSAYVLEKENEPTVFWTGDTLLTDEMKAFVLKLQPEICIVHAGGAILPIDANGNMSQLVMNGDDTVELANLVPNAKIIAIHMESLDHCPVTRKQLKDIVQSTDMEERFYIPTDGESMSF